VKCEIPPKGLWGHLHNLTAQKGQGVGLSPSPPAPQPASLGAGRSIPRKGCGGVPPGGDVRQPSRSRETCFARSRETFRPTSAETRCAPSALLAAPKGTTHCDFEGVRSSSAAEQDLFNSAEERPLLATKLAWLSSLRDLEPFRRSWFTEDLVPSSL